MLVAWKKQQGLGFTNMLLVLLIIALAGAIYWMTSAGTKPAQKQDTSVTSDVSDSHFAIDNVRVFDGQQVYENQSVLVRDGLIIGRAKSLDISDNINRIDGTGKTLLPGLIDSHVHTFGTAQQDALRFGVTTAIDLFTSHQSLAGYRAMREQINQQDQADVYSAGTLVTAPRGHGTQFGMLIPTLETPKDADAFVAARQAEGSDFIKVVYEDGSQYGANIPTLDRATMTAVIKAAKARGLLSIVHVSTLAFAKHALQAGADGLAHIFSDELPDQAFIQLAQEHNAFVVPTIAVQARISGQAKLDRWLQRVDVVDQLSPMQADNLDNDFPNKHSAVLDNVIASVAALQDAGVRILAGSDAPNPGTAHGIGLHQELWWLTQAGLTPQQALRAATADIAATFGLSDRGRIAAGMRADLVLVEGNPLDNIDASLNIVQVWKDGFVVQRQLASTNNPQENTESTSSNPILSAKTLADFEGLSDTDVAKKWQVTSDIMIGGQSEANMQLGHDQQNDNAYLHVTGDIRAGGMFAWAGVSIFVGDQPMAATDASAIKRISFRARGIPGDYQLMIFSGGENNNIPAIQTLILTSDWQHYDIVLDTVADTDLNRLRAFAWTAGIGHEAFEFDLDDVQLQ